MRGLILIILFAIMLFNPSPVGEFRVTKTFWAQEETTLRISPRPLYVYELVQTSNAMAQCTMYGDCAICVLTPTRRSIILDVGVQDARTIYTITNNNGKYSAALIEQRMYIPYVENP